MRTDFRQRRHSMHKGTSDTITFDVCVRAALPSRRRLLDGDLPSDGAKRVGAVAFARLMMLLIRQHEYSRGAHVRRGIHLP